MDFHSSPLKYRDKNLDTHEWEPVILPEVFETVTYLEECYRCKRCGYTISYLSHQICAWAKSDWKLVDRSDFTVLMQRVGYQVHQVNEPKICREERMRKALK